jgi:hypothetical protein
MISLRLKGKWSIRQRQGFHSNSDGITYPLPLLVYLSIGITFHSYFFTNGGESIIGLQSYPFLAINAKGGENIKPKAKGPHHHHFQISKWSFNWYFSNWHLSRISISLGIYVSFDL